MVNVEEEKEPTEQLTGFAKKIQDVLYSVADGFEIPTEVNQENHAPEVEVTY